VARRALPLGSRIARLSRSMVVFSSLDLSTRMPLSVTETWSTSAARPEPEPPLPPDEEGRRAFPPGGLNSELAELKV
jgi:hypothetical protein